MPATSVPKYILDNKYAEFIAEIFNLWKNANDEMVRMANCIGKDDNKKKSEGYARGKADAVHKVLEIGVSRGSEAPRRDYYGALKNGIGRAYGEYVIAKDTSEDSKKVDQLSGYWVGYEDEWAALKEIVRKYVSDNDVSKVKIEEVFDYEIASLDACVRALEMHVTNEHPGDGFKCKLFLDKNGRPVVDAHAENGISITGKVYCMRALFEDRYGQISDDVPGIYEVAFKKRFDGSFSFAFADLVKAFPDVNGE